MRKLNISYQAPTKIMRGEQMLKSQSSCKEILQMYLEEWDVLIKFFIAGKTRQQVPPRCVAYVLQRHFKEELD